ncbi:MAG: calcium-binding protein [Pseudomonadota bacterium]
MADDNVSVTGNGTDEHIVTGAGDDSVNAGGGGDVVEAGSGNDNIQGDAANDGLGPDLLVNGALEAGTGANSWALNGNPTGWQSAQGGIESWGGNFNQPTEDGGNSVELDRNAGEVDAIYQDVQTVQGKEYVLDFSAAQRDGGQDTIEVYFAGEKVADVKPDADGNWHGQSFTVTGTGGEDRLEFRELAGEDDSLGGLLDNISLREIGGATEAGADFLMGGAGDDTLVGDLGAQDDFQLGESVLDRDGLLEGQDLGGNRIVQNIAGLTAGASYEMCIMLPAAVDGEDLAIYWRGEEVARVAAEDRTEAGEFSFTIDGIAGNEGDEIVIEGVMPSEIGEVHFQEIIVAGVEDRGHGDAGNDSLTGEGGNDLLVGDAAGSEWTFVEGRWVYDGSKVDVTAGDTPAFDDTIDGGQGMDVLIGQGGDDVMHGMAGRDTINAGTGDDEAYGGRHNDLLNLEEGDDLGVGGSGADTVNAGAGDDVVYGDNIGENMVESSNEAAQSMAQHAEGGAWTMATEADTGAQTMTQVIDTAKGVKYNLEFDLAANAATGSAGGQMEVLWNGRVVDTIDVSSGIFEKYSVNVKGTGGTDELTFRAVPTQDDTAQDGPAIHTDHPINYYDAQMEIGGETVDVAAFAPGQAKLYQVISGQLKVFDPVAEEYQDAGPATGLGMNAIGYNTEDDMLYGLARDEGTDALGNQVDRNDVVTIDAKGNVYRVGESGANSFVGDFDGDGNLWAFNNSLNHVQMIDVDNIGPDGNPESIRVDLPNDFFEGKIFDIAYNVNEDVFYAVEAPAKNGEPGTVHRIDLSDAPNGGEPVIESVPIAGTLVEDVMKSGFPKGAFGAVFMDGEGNLYAGLNKGDHDLGAADTSGGIYKINIDWEQGVAHGELKAASQITNKNDGAVDPRSSDAFAEVDQTADLLIRAPVLTDATSGNDNLRGAAGDDLIYGGGGGDKIFGGDDEDQLYGDAGHDKMRGDAGEDNLFGGLGNDKMFGGADNDELDGGAGNDVMFGGAGDDKIESGAGNDKVFGNAGADNIDTGDGDDRAFGGEGADVISTGDGDDKAFGGAGADKISGGDGADVVDGGAGADELFGGAGNDVVKGGAGDDHARGGTGDDNVLGGDGSDTVEGGLGNDKVVGGAGADTLMGGEGDDHLWGGKWAADGEADVFVKGQGTGTDFIHDFEAQNDVVDLSAYDISFDDLQGAMTDVGWATQIELTGFSGEEGDRIFLKSVDKDDLSEDNFNL